MLRVGLATAELENPWFIASLDAGQQVGLPTRTAAKLVIATRRALTDGEQHHTDQLLLRRRSAFCIKAGQAVLGKPVIDRFDQDVLDVPIMFDGVGAKLLGRLVFESCDRRPLTSASVSIASSSPAFRASRAISNRMRNPAVRHASEA